MKRYLPSGLLGLGSGVVLVFGPAIIPSFGMRSEDFFESFFEIFELFFPFFKGNEFVMVLILLLLVSLPVWIFYVLFVNFRIRRLSSRFVVFSLFAFWGGLLVVLGIYLFMAIQAISQLSF